MSWLMVSVKMFASCYADGWIGRVMVAKGRHHAGIIVEKELETWLENFGFAFGTFSGYPS
jgi:hypothetical protein